MTITFWKHNRLDQEHSVQVEKIISDFLESKYYQYYKDGMRFERAMLSHLTIYGSFEFIKDSQWDELHDLFNSKTSVFNKKTK